MPFYFFGIRNVDPILVDYHHLVAMLTSEVVAAALVPVTGFTVVCECELVADWP